MADKAKRDWFKLTSRSGKDNELMSIAEFQLTKKKGNIPRWLQGHLVTMLQDGRVVTMVKIYEEEV
jgi:hypothetical protein